MAFFLSIPHYFCTDYIRCEDSSEKLAFDYINVIAFKLHLHKQSVMAHDYKSWHSAKEQQFYGLTENKLSSFVPVALRERLHFYIALLYCNDNNNNLDGLLFKVSGPR